MEPFIFPGTTPTFQFKLPFETSAISNGYISFSKKYDDEPFLEKSMQECTLSGNVVSVRLTQEESLKIPQNAEFEAQITVKNDTGDRVTSFPIKFKTGKVFKDEVI